MRHTLIFTVLIFLVSKPFAQNQKLIQRSWIKMSIENLSNQPVELDTIYTRYTFTKSDLNISFYPGWDDYKQTWTINKDKVKIGFDTYKIETLTDSTLTIALDGFRRINFMAEDYLSSQGKYLILLGEYNGKPFYKANHYISPRYIGNTSFRDFIQKKVEGYNIKKASHFFMTFIVTETGKIENANIVKGISEGFDMEIVKWLLKSAKDWKPANFQGKPIQTQMFYEIKYLDSLTPFNFGNLN